MKNTPAPAVSDARPWQSQQRDKTVLLASFLMVAGLFAIGRAWSLLADARTEAEDSYARADKDRREARAREARAADRRHRREHPDCCVHPR